MDIITQTVLGASVGELVLGKKVGNKAVFWGAITGVIPDLDVLITGFFSEVDGLFVHRGFTHSLIFAFLLAPLLSYLIYKILHKRSLATRKDWFRLVFWSAFTHPILDYFTTYGTGAFAPFSNYRVEFSTIGIVDVFYTLPMILALAVLMFFNRNSKIRRKFIVCVLSLSTFYLLLTVVNKINVNHQFEKGFSNQNINYERIRTNPVPLTNFLWMGIAEVDSGYTTQFLILITPLHLNL
jgi:inner membrane protein